MSNVEKFKEKIKNDREWYFKNFLKIRNKNAQIVPLELNYAQKKFLEQIEKDEKQKKPLRYVILKARQLGMSTFTEGLIFHKTANNENINSLIIAHEEKASQNLFNMSKLYYDELPSAIRPKTKYANGKILHFANPSKIESEVREDPGLRSKITIATAGTSNTGRSNTFHAIHISELAFWQNQEESMLALMQCVPRTPESIVVVESTANGVGDYFYDLWNKAVEGENDFTPLFFPWMNDPNYTIPFDTEEQKKEFIELVNEVSIDENGKERHTEEYLLIEEFGVTYEQLNWRKWMIANACGGSLDLFHQEYPSTPDEAFISSGRPVFDTSSLKEYRIACTEPIRRADVSMSVYRDTVKEPVDSPKGALSIWLEPEEDETYTIGVDVAEGLERGDYSVATVLDEELNVCAIWRGHVDPDLFGKILVNLCYYYNYAYLAVERNNHGHTCIKSITDEEYWNIFYAKTYDKLNNVLTKRVGFQTNKKSKPLIIDKLAEFIREQYLHIWDERIIQECLTYVIDERGRTNAQEGCHDDMVMSLAIALHAALEDVGEDYVPEVMQELRFEKKKKKNIDEIEIIDPLFEAEDDGECYFDGYLEYTL